MQYPHHLAPVLLVLLTACGGGAGDTFLDITYDPCEPILVVPAEGVTPAQRQGITEAIELWDAVLENGLAWEAPAGAQELPISFETSAPMFLGIYLDEQGAIVINGRIGDPRALAVVIAHEMGHALGLWHDDDRRSVMNSGNAEIAPNRGDAAAVVAIWGECRDRAMEQRLAPASSTQLLDSPGATTPRLR